MPAEVLLDALSQTLDVPTKFPASPGDVPRRHAGHRPAGRSGAEPFPRRLRPARPATRPANANGSTRRRWARRWNSSTRPNIQQKLTAESGYVDAAGGDRRSRTRRSSTRSSSASSPARRAPRSWKRRVEFLAVRSPTAQEAYRSLLWSLAGDERVPVQSLRRHRI